MSAAIYARKSTEQRGSEETKSTARQIASARVFAQRLGLPPIDDAHVYTDEAVSGADTKNLRARARLIADVEAGLITDIVMADMSRFSRRDGAEVTVELKRLAKRASIWFYETGAKFTSGDIGLNIANYAVAESNADYRRKVRTKTMDAMRLKAEHGHVLTGKTFGYQNVKKMGTDHAGRPVHSHVEREILESEAVVIREIYQRYANGQGFKAIASALNAKGAPKPRPRPGRPASWATSSVRSMLLQPLYRGIAKWNRLRMHDEDGPAPKKVNPEGEQISAYNPAWRIVSEELAAAVDARFADASRRKFAGKPGAGRTKYLLSGGMLICPACGGRFEVMNGKYYVCATRRNSGYSVCSNPLALRVEIFDDYVLQFLDGQVLHPAFIEQVLNLACGNQPDDGRASMEAQRADLTTAIKRLVDLVELGVGDVAEIAGKIKAREAERSALDRKIATLAPPPDREALRGLLNQRAKDWRKILRSQHPEEARHVVRQLIGPLTLWVGTSADYFGTDEQRAALVAAGIDLDDTAGRENLDFSDYGFSGVITPAGLISGLGAFSMVAGACNRRDLVRWWTAA